MKIGEDAKLFRDTYYRLYNYKHGKNLGSTTSVRFDGGEDAFGRMHTPVWPRLAKKLTDRRIDIVDYLEEVFDRCSIRTPHDTVKEYLIQNYLDSASNNDLVKRIWDSEDAVLERSVKLRLLLGDAMDRAVMVTVMDRTLDVSPLTRYLFALLNNAVQYLDNTDLKDAYEQYEKRHAAYDKWCHDRIPPEWRDK